MSFFQKGHDILVESISKIESDFSSEYKVLLHFVGDEADLEKLKLMVANKLKNIQVFFYVWVSDV